MNACVSVSSMAVPFVQDWDVVQTLGEGAYGEYERFLIIVYHQLIAFNSCPLLAIGQGFFFLVSWDHDRHVCTRNVHLIIQKHHSQETPDSIAVTVSFEKKVDELGIKT